MSWHYPLIKEVRGMYRTTDMSDVLLLACQHLLGSQYQMFTSLTKLGLKPKDCIIAGKPYSTSPQVENRLRRAGFSVAPWSSTFVPEESFDTWFERNLDEFIGGELQLRNLDHYRQIVVLDDGGFLHTVCKRHLGQRENVAGVEQTTSGDTRIRALNLSYDVLSLARSYIKQRHEAPYIGQLACQRILKHLAKRGKGNPRILVLGLGTIGRQVLGRLRFLGKCEASGYDRDFSQIDQHGAIELLLSHRALIKNLDEVHEKMAQFDVIVGASGYTLFDETQLDKLHPNVSLISVSSSDREFPALYFRRESLRGVHDDYYVGNRCLVNAGFPITFYGNYHEVPPKEIELTVACLMAAVLQKSQTEGYEFPFELAPARLVPMWQAENQVC